MQINKLQTLDYLNLLDFPRRDMNSVRVIFNNTMHKKISASKMKCIAVGLTFWGTEVEFSAC
jgi:hypothetical protein